MDNLAALGKEIQTRRKDREWTQEELGRRSSVRRQTVGSIERGKFTGRISDVARVAHVLGCRLALAAVTQPQFEDLKAIFDED